MDGSITEKNVLDELYLVAELEHKRALKKHGNFFVDGDQAYGALREEWKEVKVHFDAVGDMIEQFQDEMVMQENYIDTESFMKDLGIHAMEMAKEALHIYTVARKIAETVEDFPEMDVIKYMRIGL